MTDIGNIFEDDVEIIENAEALEEEYTPKELVCREGVLEEYAKVFKPIYKGRPPKNAFLYGDTGVGKTASTKYMTEQLEEQIQKKNETVSEDEEINFTVVWVNCENITRTNNETSSYQIGIDIVNQFRESGNKLSRTGYAPKDVYSSMYDIFDELGGTILVVLDEINKIGDDKTLLYDLPRARDNGYIEDARVGVIGISNDYMFRKSIDPKIKDSLCEVDISFPQYDAVELGEIVDARSETALYDDTITQGAINMCGSLAYKEDGSARRAIRLLKEAAETAEEEGSETVTEAHVESTNEELDHDNVVSQIADQDDQKLYIMKALAHLTSQEMTPARTGTVHTAYESIVDAYGYDPLTQRAMYNHLSKLVMFGFVDSQEYNRGEDGGRWSEHYFSEEVTSEMVETAYEKNEMEWLQADMTGIESY